MSGSTRSGIRRITLVMAAGLLLIATCVAVPAFVHGQAAAIPFGSVAFAAQWSSIEPTVPNFWGPAVQPAMHEPYSEATSGTRLVQYFDKARMEQTTAGGAVTNGLLTVELITGQRQMGDQRIRALPALDRCRWSATRPIRGRPMPRSPTPSSPNMWRRAANRWGPSISQTAPSRSIRAWQRNRGPHTASIRATLGGKYGHNIPLAFSSYLAALPVPWQTTMGFPLTEPFWVQVTVNNVPATWVLVQPFERRVLSYTPSNPTGFQVEMGNIGQHYFQWRYPATSTPYRHSGCERHRSGHEHDCHCHGHQHESCCDAHDRSRVAYTRPAGHHVGATRHGDRIHRLSDVRYLDSRYHRNPLRHHQPFLCLSTRHLHDRDTRSHGQSYRSPTGYEVLLCPPGNGERHVRSAQRRLLRHAGHDDQSADSNIAHSDKGFTLRNPITDCHTEYRHQHRRQCVPKISP